ncbi:MAG: hypothetical protein ACLFQV_00990 [Vulcanimicrobiota bacterium]
MGIEKVNLSGMNPALQAEVLNKAKNAGFMKKSVKSGNPNAIEALDNIGGEVGNKPDIIRQTHLKMFFDADSGKIKQQNIQNKQAESSKVSANLKKKENLNKAEGVEISPAKNPISDKDQVNMGQIRTSMDNLGGRTVIVKKQNVDGIKLVNGPDSADFSSIVNQLIRRKNGVYTTTQGFQVTMFKDKKTGMAYFTILVPQSNGKMEEISIFTNPQTPNKVNVLSRNVISQGQAMQ